MYTDILLEGFVKAHKWHMSHGITYVVEHTSIRFSQAGMYVFHEPCYVYLQEKYNMTSYHALTKMHECTEPYRVLP